MAKIIKQEKLHQSIAQKKVYYYVDSERGINQKSREIYKHKDIEVHYPIAYFGGPKYNYTRKFEYIGFNGKLPVGVIKSPSKGLGFTKVLKPLMDYLESNFKIEKIKILKKGKSGFSTNRRILSFVEDDLGNLHKMFQTNLLKHKQENSLLTVEQLHRLFPKQVKKGAKKYIPNSVSSALSTWGQSLSEFSDRDKNSIKELFDKLTLTRNFLNTDTLLKTKETLDEQYIEDVIRQFKLLLKQKKETKTLEKKWQKFLKKHSWIFSFIFSYPIILFEDEAYVGGKNISNKDGKVTDFLIKNNLTQNVAFIEIKTHKTKIFKRAKAYRGTDVFATSTMFLKFPYN